MTPLLICDGTVIDAVADAPRENCSILMERGRITAIAPQAQLRLPPEVRKIDARGRFVIPGLMNANVHLFMAVNLESLARYTDRFEDIIAEAAQVALRSGLTTVFDTWGPRRYLMSVRDSISSGQTPGSRFFCAGNIIGLDGLFSPDFFAHADKVASAVMVKRINSIWAENVGRHLMWLTPTQIGREVRAYLAKGIDFVKYASNEHYPGAFLAFSERQQRAIVEEAHRAGTTAQAHSMSVEGLRVAVEAGCDLIQHCNKTGPVPIPEETLERMVERNVGAVVFPHTQRGIEWLVANLPDTQQKTWLTADLNVRNLIRAGARLLMANDGAIMPPEWPTDPQWGKSWVTAPDEVNLSKLATGHFVWFKAMEEKGCPSLEILRAATRNIAIAYGKDKDLGTLEPGKIADAVVLDKDPLASAENYQSIEYVIKDGMVVDRESLPRTRIMSRQLDAPVEEEAAYVPFLSSGRFPCCC